MPYGGFEYGDEEYGAALAVTNPPDLLLYQTRLGTNFRALLEIAGARHEAFRANIEQVLAGFDIDIAEGVQLDVLGALLGEARQGGTDAEFRVRLKIQVLIMLSSTATADTIQRVIDAFTGDPPEYYINEPPAAFSTGAIVDADDTPALLRLLTRAKGGGIAMQFAALETGYLLSDEDADPLDNPMNVDEVVDPVDEAGIVATIYEA